MPFLIFSEKHISYFPKLQLNKKFTQKGGIVISRDNHIIELPHMVREKMEFRIIKVPCRDSKNGTGVFPAIYLFNTETGEMIGPTDLELYLIHHIRASNTLETIMKAAKWWVRFLNYILHEEDINGLEQIDRKLLTRYAEHIKLKEIDQAKWEDEEISPGSWSRHLKEIYNCLANYYKYNHKKAVFHYIPEELGYYQEKYNKETGKTEDTFVLDWSTPPSPKELKIRYLPEKYLTFWFHEVRIHAPHLLLANMLQAYAGLREGAVVNLTWDKLIIPKGFGEIRINIKDPAEHVKEHKGKTKPGNLKKHKNRKVYPDFKNDVRDEYMNYKARTEVRLRKMGKTIDPKGPLFFSKTGLPLTTDLYNKEMKEIFKEYFVPDLKEYCLATGQYEAQKALIDAYETEFFGNHVFRHWFTMYLKLHVKLDDVQIMNWRGDESEKSYRDYMHINRDIIENFDKVVFHFQEDMFEAIKDGRAERFYKEKRNDRNKRNS